MIGTIGVERIGFERTGIDRLAGHGSGLQRKITFGVRHQFNPFGIRLKSRFDPYNKA
jgi:hypothetical protein